MRAHPIALRALFFALALSGAAWAANLDDDYKSGEAAWRAGDMAGAMSTLRGAADKGHAPAQALLADILDKAEFNVEAVAYFRKSAEQGNADGQYGLGTMYLAGEGIGRDLEQALRWFTRAAEQNHLDAVKAAAQMHIAALGQASPSAVSVGVAVKMIQRAADLRYLPAIDWLAGSYRNGAFGLVADMKQAEAWEAKARELRKASGDRRRKR